MEAQFFRGLIRGTLYLRKRGASFPPVGIWHPKTTLTSKKRAYSRTRNGTLGPDSPRRARPSHGYYAQVILGAGHHRNGMNSGTPKAHHLRTVGRTVRRFGGFGLRPEQHLGGNLRNCVLLAAMHACWEVLSGSRAGRDSSANGPPRSAARQLRRWASAGSVGRKYIVGLNRPLVIRHLFPAKGDDHG